MLADVTRKLVAAPRARRTLALAVDGLAAGLELARRALARALVASAIVIESRRGAAGRYRLLYTAEGLPEEVEVELAGVEEIFRRAGDVAEVERTGTEAWTELLGSAGAGVAVRAGVPVGDLAEYLEALADRQGARLLVDCPAGLVYAVRRPADQDDAAAWIEELRRPALALGGYAVVVSAPPDLAGSLDRWGYRPEALDVMRRLKARWDPAGILEPGTFVF